MLSTNELIQTDVQEVVYRGNGFTLCRFHCPRHHRRWSQVNTIRDGHNVVFPRTFVTIEQAGAPEVRADSNQAVLYNYGTDFRRRPTSRFDDRSDVFLIDAVALIEAMKPYDASVVDRPHRPFEHCAGTVDSMTLHQERLLFAYLRGTAVPDDGLVHDTVFGIIDAVIQGIACREQPRRTPGSATLTRNRERVDAALEFLAKNYLTQITLDDVAQSAACSVYHLCRVFRQAMDVPIHRYLNRLRLRAALDALLDDPVQLAHLARRVGFSHQSHFTESFRREFGTTPAKLLASHSRSVQLHAALVCQPE